MTRAQRGAQADLPPLLALLQQRRLQLDTVGQQAQPAPAPAPSAPSAPRDPAVCACRWAAGPHCEALLRAENPLATAVGNHIMRGGSDLGCPGRRLL